jgi:lipopolysaccharide heptosyltransferase II
LKILILKPSSLGDVVQALPVLRLLKQHLPESRIYWWIETGLAPLLEGDPDLAGLILFDRKRWGSPRHWGEVWRAIRDLREHRFDWVIDLQCLARSGAVAWLANGQLLVGLDERREAAAGYYDLAARRASYHTHAVDWYLAVLPLLQVPVHWDFTWLPARPAAAASLAQKWMPGLTPWIALQPGARWLNKRWPVEHFAELVGRLAEARSEVRFAILGGKEDREMGQAIADAAPARCTDLTGLLSLAEMVECLRACSLMVTNDTGPMHVAAALRKPVVGLFGPTEPRRTGPYGQTDRALRLDLPCVPCMKSRCHYPEPMACLRRLTPERVCAAVLEALNLNPDLALNLGAPKD